MSQAVADVEKRRREQDAMHGGSGTDDRRTPEEWLCLLAKFLGRASESSPKQKKNAKLYREALVDLAAVSQAAIESLDRKGGF